jgi:hypothetical protein
MSLRDLSRTTENKALYDGRLTVNLHYTERHDTTKTSVHLYLPALNRQNI